MWRPGKLRFMQRMKGKWAITNYLRHTKVRNKLLALIAVSVVFLAGVGSCGYLYLKEMNASLKDMYYERVLPIKWVNTAGVDSRAIEADTYRMMLIHDSAERALLIDEIAGLLKDYDQAIADYESTKLDETETEILNKLKMASSVYRDQNAQILQMMKDGLFDSAYTKYSSYAAGILDGMNELLEQLADYNANQADKVYQANNESYNKAVSIIIAVLFSALALCSIVGIVISRMITRPLRNLQELTAQAADGDMRVRCAYASGDELGLLAASFNRMLEDTGSIIRQVNETSLHVAASSEELTASAEQTGRSSERIATSAQEVAAGAAAQEDKVKLGLGAVQQVTELAAQVAGSSQSLAVKASETANVAQDGSRKVQDVCSRMSLIDRSVNQLSDVIRELDQRSEQIGGIAVMMKEIANQTNLLALNASIEAARAGEQGRGFSVVAAEVRKLAEQAIEASQQVQGLTTSIRVQTKEAVTSITETSHQVSEGIGIAEMTEQFFGSIDRSITELAQRMKTMSGGAHEMADQSVVICTAIEQISSITGESAEQTQQMSAATQEQMATMEEMASSSRQLAVMASELQTLISRFRV